jgi:trimethylamine--corrinoid protein Co-methyltransferase
MAAELRTTMPQKGLQGRKLNLLSGKRVSQIHETSLRILDEVGVRVADGEIRRRLASEGAVIDEAAQLVRLPRKVVERLLALAPAEFVLAGRNPEHNLRLGNRRVHLGTGGAAVRVLDLDDGTYRPSTLADQHALARLVEVLENVHFFQCPVVCSDVPKESVTINSFYAALAGTTKNVQESVTRPEAATDVIEMAAMIAGGLEELSASPFISFVCSLMISPLRLDCGVVRCMEVMLEAGIPVAVSCAPVTGLSAPATLAGLLTLAHAEQMFAIGLAQAIRPAARVLYGVVPGVANMWNMGFLGGAIEAGMMNAAAVLLAKHVGVPIYTDAGATDAKMPDIQAGYEKAFSILQVALSGGDYVHHSTGILDSLMTVAYEQFVIDNDINGMATRVLEGITVNDETLAYDVIRDVGPGGLFLTQEHTRRFARSREFYVPSSLNRRPSQDGEAEMDLRQHARCVARRLLDQERAPLIPSDVDEEIRRRFDIRLPRHN